MLGKNVAAGQHNMIHVCGFLSVPEQIIDPLIPGQNAPKRKITPGDVQWVLLDAVKVGFGSAED